MIDTMKQKKYSSLRGSVLAYTLIVLAILMIASVGLLTATVSNMRSALLTDNSANAFQTADSAAQRIFARLKEMQKRSRLWR